MKQIFYCFLITVLVQFNACYPADDTISNMMSSMSGFANRSESSMESMTSSKNTSQTFTSSNSNLLLEAAKNLDINNFTSDEEFLRLLFESVFSIIRDTKSEELLFFSDLTVIVPSILEKIIKQLQAAFFNVFFGGFVNAGITAADMGLKIATALETGKLSAASQGIETAQNIADTIASNVPSNGFTDEVTKIVNATLDGADGAIKAAKNLQTEGSKAISNVLDRFKMANASTNPVDISSKIASTVETAKQSAASEAVESAQEIADKIAGSVPSNGVTDEDLPGDAVMANRANSIDMYKKKKTDEVKKIVSTSLEGANAATKVAKTLETAKLTAASQGVESAQKIADKIAGSVPSNGVTDAVKKIVSTSLEGANDATKAAKTLQTVGANAIGGVFNTFKFGK